jgi:hypothetical protein
MRKSPKRQPESVVFDRSPGLHKLEGDLDVAVTAATSMGVSHADIVRALLTQADRLCVIAHEAGEDLSSLEGLLA